MGGGRHGPIEWYLPDPRAVFDPRRVHLSGSLFFSSRRGHTRFDCDWSSDVCSSDLNESDSDDPHPCELFHNNGDGTFTEVAAAMGVANVGYVKAVVWGGFNNDGRPDLYLSDRKSVV